MSAIPVTKNGVASSSIPSFSEASLKLEAEATALKEIIVAAASKALDNLETHIRTHIDESGNVRDYQQIFKNARTSVMQVSNTKGLTSSEKKRFDAIVGRFLLLTNILRPKNAATKELYTLAYRTRILTNELDTTIRNKAQLDKFEKKFEALRRSSESSIKVFVEISKKTQEIFDRHRNSFLSSKLVEARKSLDEMQAKIEKKRKIYLERLSCHDIKNCRPSSSRSPVSAAPSLPPIGIPNSSTRDGNVNNCFIIAFFQAASPIIIDKLLNTTDPRLSAWKKFAQQYVSDQNGSRRVTTANPGTLRASIQLSGYGQEDASECGISVLAKLLEATKHQISFNEYLSYTQSSTKKTAASTRDGSDWGLRQVDPFSRTETCYDPLRKVNVKVPVLGTLQEVIDSSFTETRHLDKKNERRIDGVSYDAVRSTKTYLKPPPFLVTHVKRTVGAELDRENTAPFYTDFFYPRGYVSSTRQVPSHRTPGPIPLQIEGLGEITLSPKQALSESATRYVPVGFVCHERYMHGGHYIAYRKVGNDWYKCDDGLVTLEKNMSAVKEKMSTALMLFHQRVDPK